MKRSYQRKTKRSRRSGKLSKRSRKSSLKHKSKKKSRHSTRINSRLSMSRSQTRRYNKTYKCLKKINTKVDPNSIHHLTLLLTGPYSNDIENIEKHIKIYIPDLTIEDYKTIKNTCVLEGDKPKPRGRVFY